MEQTDVRKTIDITIVKYGRIWTEIEVHYNTGRSGKAKVKKEYVADKKPGENIQVTGYLKREGNGYGVKTELIILSDEEFRERKEKLHKKDIEKWIQYFRKNAKDGNYYGNAVDKLHELGCHDYDKEIQQTHHELEISKWWGYFLKNYDNGKGYIYERAISELHKLDCYDYDKKIKECRETVIRAREAAGIRNIVTCVWWLCRKAG